MGQRKTREERLRLLVDHLDAVIALQAIGAQVPPQIQDRIGILRAQVVPSQKEYYS